MIKVPYLRIRAFLSFSLSTPPKHKIIYTHFLPEPVPVSVISPKNYNPAQSYSLLYLLHGYMADYRQWSYITDLQSVADNYGLIMVTPHGLRTFYMDSLVTDAVRYETFFFETLVPWIHQTFNINSSKIFISGLSMGGYGALNLLLKRPGYFTAAGSSSGAVDFDHSFWEEISHQYFHSHVIIEDLEMMLGTWPAAKDKWEKWSLVNRTLDIKITGKPVIIDCGTEDPLYEMNIRFMMQLNEQNIISHTLLLPGEHNNLYWSKSFQHHLDFFLNST